jgi:hypothetical protein
LVVTVAVAGCSHRTDRSQAGGVRGQLLIGPQCPGNPPTSPCQPKPIVGVVTALKGVGHAVAAVKTDTAGHFRLPLAPGTYQIWARELGDNPRIAKPLTVNVTAGTFAEITLTIDSGIR